MWGDDEPPAVGDPPPPLPPHLAALAAVREPFEAHGWLHPRPEELPEVAALAAAGWRVAPANPMWAFLPAVWPPAQRCWVPDRLPRFSRSGPARRGGPVTVIPWTDEVARSVREPTDEALTRLGFPGQPLGPTWLLRSPWPSIAVDAVPGLMAARAAEQGGGDTLDATLVTAAQELLTWDEDRVWAWWPGEQGDVARAWRAAGRTGADAAEVVLARMSPAAMAAFRGLGFEESKVVAWYRTVGRPDDFGVDRARAWADRGLEPDDVTSYLGERAPHEIDAWLSAGFTVPEMRELRKFPLDVALAWREAGVGPDELFWLRYADESLTPAEAARFRDLGFNDDERYAWVDRGFDADTPRAWADLDVLPNEARVWRAAGLDPADAAPVLAALPPDAPRIPPDHTGGWWTIGPVAGRLQSGEIDHSDPEVRAARWWSVTDPPGTRGSGPGGRRRGA